METGFLVHRSVAWDLFTIPRFSHCIVTFDEKNACIWPSLKSKLGTGKPSSMKKMGKH